MKFPFWTYESAGSWEALTCPKCHRVYRLGDNASISTLELVAEAIGSLEPGDGYGNTQAVRHDAIHPKSAWTSAERVRAVNTMQKVREALAKGAQRRWTCGNCKHTGIRYPDG